MAEEDHAQNVVNKRRKRNINNYINSFIIAILLITAIQDIRTKTISLWLIVMGMIIVLVYTIYLRVNFLIPIGGILVGVLVVIISIATKGKIGMGDGLILMVTGINLGFWRNLEMFLYSLCIAAIISIILLIFKKVKKKDSLPFVPFILAGYILIVIT